MDMWSTEKDFLLLSRELWHILVWQTERLLSVMPAQ